MRVDEGGVDVESAMVGVWCEVRITSRRWSVSSTSYSPVSSLGYLQIFSD